jgi:hypothetical protein
MIKETFAPFNLPLNSPEVGPMLIFKDVSPIYMKVNFLKWCDIVSAEIGASRQLEDKVIKHMRTEFIGLINAVHCIASCMEDQTKMADNYRHYADNYYKKDVDNVLDPFEFICAFFKGITEGSARSILWLLMELVAANKERYEYLREQKEILSLYERFSASLTVAYGWHKGMKEYRQSKKGGPKNKKKK